MKEMGNDTLIAIYERVAALFIENNLEARLSFEDGPTDDLTDLVLYGVPVEKIKQAQDEAKSYKEECQTLYSRLNRMAATIAQPAIESIGGDWPGM